ncbi:hypothetical protein [Spirillospora sp. CA-294931]|uniref:hypothetical protein n=1 Tax=Spirillospora sp. CA-294931 TaxID=3240042 RepID=UPI003D93642F
MLKRLAVTGLVGSAAFLAFAATPAHAEHGDDGDQGNVQIIGVQTCRSVDVVGIGAAIHNILGITNEGGDCNNGSTVD